MAELPTTARAVIIGGGIIGCSTAYHMGKLGWTDTVLLERKKLTSGTTFHAAGLVGQLRTSANITQLLGYSVELYKKLEAETGLQTGWKMNGGLRLACNAERWTEVKRQATTAHSFGLEMHLLTPKEAQDLWPLMTIDDLVGAAYLPTDGQANPSDITQSLAKGARMAGVKIFEDTPVTRVIVEDGRIRGVETPFGTIECEKVICCAGQWTRTLAASVGVNVPLVSVEHQYMITEKIEGVTSGLPTLRDPDRLTYWKEDVGGLVWGGYEPNPKPWAVNGIPEGFHFDLLTSDYDHYGQFMEDAIARVPALATAGVKQLLNGPESFTPDGNFILGEAPELRNFYVGAGFNAFGIASGGGAGMALAEWAAKGEAPYDLWPVDIRRFGKVHQSTDWVRTRTLEAYGKHYTIAWPSEEMKSARPTRRSPLYAHLKAAGACFGEKLGWERPNWFADLSKGEVPVDRYSYQRPGWWDQVKREHQAAREAAVLIDQTSFAKFTLKGSDAARALNYIAAGNVDRAVGSLTYTQMLNKRGGIEADVTVARTAWDEFYIVTGTGFATHDFDWISRNLTGNCQLVDVTAGSAVLSLMGPEAREILARVSGDDLTNAGFPFGTARRISVASCPVLALRVTYVGELGWELHMPTDVAVTVYDALMAAGAGLGLRNAGYRAIETLRLEKGYRAWGADIGPDHTPVEAGLAWACKMKSGVDFIGRDAVAAQLAGGVKKRLAGFTVDDPSVILLGRETIYRDGVRVGWLSSGGFGHTVGKPVGYGFVRHKDGVTEDFMTSGEYELEVASERVRAKLHLGALYDPAGGRIKA
ncbi:MAG: FAD-dependent oxidoreductase [Rhodobacterales bacterium RIFCSPHIGHO2_02_FULL_62_130]|nr:MAG: FAD-dependent oxidoreductase [Rhodobacterales bacterium RIFCSPHIGHO2_02_FULL_62_130]OHC59014.1 MAG: FAD-dependent oxidoreductase [Rhodobacterales bacterium RIFCSPHIGHO2_12_FULL_62_75]HCZ00660.1 FAD-dependent oxidoreductase [Rhodobacter sp.]